MKKKKNQKTRYGTKYKLEKPDPKLLQSWKNCGDNTELTIPRKNPYIADDFTIKCEQLSKQKNKTKNNKKKKIKKQSEFYICKYDFQKLVFLFLFSIF